MKVDLMRLKWTKCDAETATGGKGNTVRLSQRRWEFYLMRSECGNVKSC